MQSNRHFSYGTTTDSPAPRHFPVCIPNGLAATMATIGSLHEKLVAQGFTVLSYDRYAQRMSKQYLYTSPVTVPTHCVASEIYV